MHITVAAVFIQIFCCLALPLFTGMATKTDNEGNAEYDLTPLIGAYIVTCMKYFALFLIFGGSAAVGISMFMITPETARSDNVMFSGFTGIIGFLISFMVILLIIMVLSSAKILGLAIKLAIESVDRTLLGVDVDVGTARLSICRGFVNLANTVVHNPEGYKTPYLLSVGKVVVKLDMIQLIKSFGKHIEIEALILSNVDIIFEKSRKSSNAQDILNHLDGDTTPQVEPVKKEKQKEEVAENPVQVILHRVDIVEVGAKVASTFLGGRGIRVALGNIDYEDFQEQCHGKVQVPDVIKIILETLMKTVLANTNVTGFVGETAEKAKSVVLAVEQKGESLANLVGEKARKGARWLSDHLPFSPRTPGSTPPSSSKSLSAKSKDSPTKSTP